MEDDDGKFGARGFCEHLRMAIAKEEMKMKIWEILKRIGVTIVGIFASSLILAIIIRLALGWDFRVMWGIFLLLGTAGAALILEHGNYIPKIPARIIAGIFMCLALYTVYPGFDYLIVKSTGKTTAKSYREYQAYNDLRIGEAMRPKSLQGREVLYAHKLKREAEIREQFQKDLDLIARSGGLYSEEELQKMETQATEAYNRRIAELNKLQTQEPAVIKIQGLEALGISLSAVVLGVLAVIAALGYWLWKKEAKGGTLSSGTPSSDGKRRMRPGLIVLAFVGYIIYFWVQYAFLRYWIVEWTGMSPFSVTLLLTVQQIIIIGILYYLIEPLVPEPGKVRRAFILISIFGALNLYVGYVAYPYEFFDFKTGESRFWVSDDEDEVYYAPGYSKLYGTQLRQGTREDAMKYKSQIESSFLAAPLGWAKEIKLPKVFGKKLPSPASAHKNSDGSLTIQADAVWIDTGRAYAKGEILEWKMPVAQVSATGDPNDGAYEIVDADGWRHPRFFDAPRPHMVNGKCPTMALVGRVGDGEWFCMKSSGRYVPDQNGKLFVSFNDAVGLRQGQFDPVRFFADNIGEGRLYLN